jgi:nitrile hydratase subunit beta
MALTVAMGATGTWNIDQSRSRRESMVPADYYVSSYYEIWLSGLEGLLQDFSLASAQELAEGRMLLPAASLRLVLASDKVSSVLRAGAPTSRPAPAGSAPRFKTGERVVSVNAHPPHHTRLPRYARGKPGRIVAEHGFHVFADSNAQGLGEAPQVLYTVEFDAHALWGPDTTASSICVDCFESYLLPAGEAS